MHILILGGNNDDKFELSSQTKIRIDKVVDMTNVENTIYHFSGGLHSMYNNTNRAHCEICKDYFLSCIPNKPKIVLHENNTNTVEEAIYFGNYFNKNHKNNNIQIVTNDWHRPRVVYLFGIAFSYFNITNYNIIGVESKDPTLEHYSNERIKLNELIHNPYGKWKLFLKKANESKHLSLKLIQKNDNHCKILLDMRNENRGSCFNNEEYDFNVFQNIFYTKYFLNEIPPYFLCIDDKIIGFIGCKTLQPFTNDIGIMFFKKYQKQGNGDAFLKLFLAAYNTYYCNNSNILIARIMKSNIGSYKLFSKNNFIPVIEKSNLTTHYLEYLSPN